MFTRMKFPSWTVTKSFDDYVNAVVRMIDDTELRKKMSEDIKLSRPDKVLYKGNPAAFADTFRDLVRSAEQ